MPNKKWRVYVIELRDGTGLGKRKNPAKAHVYVAVTSRPIDARFRTHLAEGTTGSANVREYYVGLLPALFEHIEPVSNESQAHELEDRVRAELSEAGYTALGKNGFFWDRYRKTERA